MCQFCAIAAPSRQPCVGTFAVIAAPSPTAMDVPEGNVPPYPGLFIRLPAEDPCETCGAMDGPHHLGCPSELCPIYTCVTDGQRRTALTCGCRWSGVTDGQ